MAAVVNGNTIYIVAADTATTVLSAANVLLIGAIVSSTSGAGTCVLADDISAVSSYPSKVSYQMAGQGNSFHDYSNTPILFPKGIRIKSATGDIAVTLIIRRSNG